MRKNDVFRLKKMSVKENSNKETWSLSGFDNLKEHNVSVKIGKKMDLFSLKNHSMTQINDKIYEIRNSRTNLFSNSICETVEKCPICKSDVNESPDDLLVYGLRYVNCYKCNHHFVNKRPVKSELDKFYSNSVNYQSTYTNTETSEFRLKNVAMPKLNWILEEYKQVYADMPKSILDIGAGSGHFIEACKRKEINATGIEISESGRKFAEEVFDIALIDTDFEKKWSKYKQFDIITFWGVIEHVPNPMDLIKSAKLALEETGGLIVVDVPKWNSMSTNIQNVFPDKVIRHLDPLGHISIYTEDSLVTMFQLLDIDIISAWYFGMDAYELLTQLSIASNEHDLFVNNKELIIEMQEKIDKQRLSDSIVLIGKVNGKK